jgi:branched-subunit amino acid aminotransferase/4-amino-4-deoxychorismate lyase
MSLFETIALRSGRLLFVSEHLARLKRNASVEEFPCPVALEGALADLIHREALPDGVLRIYLCAGEGAPVAVPRGCAIVMHEAAEFPGEEAIAKGYALGCSPVTYLAQPGGLKSGNYWPNVRALTWAKRHGFDEAVLFDPAGLLVSASMANIFLEISGKILTPNCLRGAREGIIRDWVMERVRVETVDITREMLAECEECFVTNSRIGVMPVAGIDGRMLPSRFHAEGLASLYRKDVLEG